MHASNRKPAGEAGRARRGRTRRALSTSTPQLRAVGTNILTMQWAGASSLAALFLPVARRLHRPRQVAVRPGCVLATRRVARGGTRGSWKTSQKFDHSERWLLGCLGDEEATLVRARSTSLARSSSFGSVLFFDVLGALAPTYGVAPIRLAVVLRRRLRRLPPGCADRRHRRRALRRSLLRPDARLRLATRAGVARARPHAASSGPASRGAAPAIPPRRPPVALTGRDSVRIEPVWP